MIDEECHAMNQNRISSEVDRRKFLDQSTKLIAGACISVTGGFAFQQETNVPRMRRVWLRLLLNQVQEDLRAGKKLTDEERFFAGLTGVKYIYLDSDSKDLIFEGPGEDRWSVRQDGIVIGAATGQPLLQLDDFAVAWRNANSPGPPPSVSLEHRQESIQRIQNVIRGTPQPRSAEARAEFLRLLQEAWGPQDAVTGGVPTNTRFNKVMVEADWVMKRISLGLSDAGVEKFPSYIDLEFRDLRRRMLAEGLNVRKPDGGSRFWFFPAYTEFTSTEKLDAVAIPDDPVQLLTESHFRNLAQGRQVVQEPTPAAKEFVEAFTKHYAPIAAANPLFADLRNLFDWVAISRLIKMLDAPRRIGWDLNFLRQPYPVAELQVPATMQGQVALRHAEVKISQGLASLVFPARGGVSIDVERSLRSTPFLPDAQLQARAKRAISERPRPQKFWRSV